MITGTCQLQRQPWDARIKRTASDLEEAREDAQVAQSGQLTHFPKRRSYTIYEGGRAIKESHDMEKLQATDKRELTKQRRKLLDLKKVNEAPRKERARD